MLKKKPNNPRKISRERLYRTRANNFVGENALKREKTPALATAIHDQLTAFRDAKFACLADIGIADGATKALWVEMFNNPICTVFFIEQISDWEFHID